MHAQALWLVNLIWFTGTHGILDVTLEETEENEYVLQTYYSQKSNTGGVLINFLYYNNQSIDLSRSTILTLERNVSRYFIPAFNLPSHVKLYDLTAYYDIEESKLLSTGVRYPAIAEQHMLSGNESNYYISYFTLNNVNAWITDEMHNENCRVTSSANNILGECPHINDDSLANGFQMIA